MQILDINSRGNELNVFCVGGKVLKYKTFYPYFYALVDETEITNIINILNLNVLITKIKVVDKYLPLGFQIKTKKLLQIYTNDPRNIKDLRTYVKVMTGIKEIYEADVLYKNRFIIDTNLGAFTDIDYNFNILEKSLIEPMRIISIDLEMLPPNSGAMPDMATDPIIMASLAFFPPYEGRNTLVLAASPNAPLGADIVGLEDEKQLLKYLTYIIKDFNPDIITGYNIDDFDFPYLVGRYSQNYINCDWGRNNSLIFIKNLANGKNTSITGRVVLDLLPLIRKNYSYQNYTLRTVAHELLEWEKLDMDMQHMRQLWLENKKEGISQICDYARRDAHLVLKLLDKTKLLDRFAAIAKKTGLLLQDCINGGQTGKIDMLIMREFKKIDRVMAMKPDFDDEDTDNDDVGYDGATVLEPAKGLLKDVVVCDYRSLYPTIMISQNYSPDSIILDRSEFMGNDEDLHKAVIGGTFINREKYIGVVPKILTKLLNERMAIKKEMKQYDKKSDTYIYLDAQQYAIKILLNSFYGYTGYTRSRLYLVDIAQAVTSFGRENILNTKNMIEGMGKIVKINDKIMLQNEISELNYDNDTIRYFNCKVVYGDTDSLFIELKENFKEYGSIDLDTIKEIGEFIADKATKRLPDPMALLYEKIAKRIVFEKKKKYAMLRYDLVKNEWKSEVSSSGLETKRRDSSPRVAETLNNCILAVLMEDNIDKALNIAKNTIKEIIKMDKIKSLDEVKDLIITRKYTKSTNLYKVQQVHIKVAEKMKSRGITLNLGDRIQYLIYKGSAKNPLDRADTPDYVLANNLEIDTKYYVNKQFFPPLKRFLNCFGIKDNEIWIDAPREKHIKTKIQQTNANHRQMSLGDW